MLQQTQIARVKPAYTAFLDRFPTVAALAEAPRAEVLRHWEGLGYHRRAANLHRAAESIVSQHGGEVPTDPVTLRSLPGVGEYTARAVACFAADQPVAPVDVNVARVLARAVAGDALGRATATRTGDRLIGAVDPGDVAAWGHAAMELGARICTAKNPSCGVCPVAESCRWRQQPGQSDGEAPDPAARNAIRSRPQSPFVGSDRYHRGRLLAALRAGSVPFGRVAEACDLASDPERASRVRAALVAEGLAVEDAASGLLQLPD